MQFNAADRMYMYRDQLANVLKPDILILRDDLTETDDQLLTSNIVITRFIFLFRR